MGLQRESYDSTGYCHECRDLDVSSLRVVWHVSVRYCIHMDLFRLLTYLIVVRVL